VRAKDHDEREGRRYRGKWLVTERGGCPFVQKVC
jgi:hypothetical protein